MNKNNTESLRGGHKADVTIHFWIASLMLAMTILFMSFVGLAEEHNDKPAAETPYAYEKDLQKAEDYLNSITNLVANFTQIAPTGDVSMGKFYLSRPGKLRWEYDPPTPVLIIANGSVITYYDYELDQVSSVKVNDTLAGVLTRPVIEFTDKDLEVFDVKREFGTLAITLQLKNKPEEGKLTLVFSDKPITLRKMDVVDANGKVTHVGFDNPAHVTELDKNLFILDKSKSPGRRS